VNILLISNLYPPYVVGGNEILARDVVEALRARGQTVHVGTGFGARFGVDPLLHACLNIDLDRLDERFRGAIRPGWLQRDRWQIFDPHTFARVSRLIAFLCPALIVLWNLGMASAAPLLAARLSRRPFLVHVADKWLLHCLYDPTGPWPPATRAGVLHHWARRRIMQQPLRALCGSFPVIAISDFVRRYYLRAGLSAQDIQTVHLGVATEEFRPGQRGRGEWSSARALCVGSLWEGKGVHIALQALGQLVRAGRGYGMHLDVYGEAAQPYESLLLALVQSERTTDHVTFHGRVDRAGVIRAMQDHDLLIFPSLWDEPFAAVPIEAMSCGLPVIATRCGGTPEAITDGVDGLLVAPGDVAGLAAAWARLADDPHERHRLGQQARATAVERFDFTDYIDRLEAIYAGHVGRNS
jgi:glycosyltransferase involved in cell wall biosynthesis